MDLRKIVLQSADRIHLAQDWDKWLAVMNTVMNFQFRKMRGIC